MIELFTNPVTKTAVFGTLWMSVSTALIGTLLFLRKRSLVGETLSHASFPGLLIGIFLASFFTNETTFNLFFFMTLGAAVFAFLGMKCIGWMEEKFKTSSDAALTFVLAAFMGFGILLASIVQKSNPADYRIALLYLYGQAATISIEAAFLYKIFTLCLILFILTFYPHLKLISFDKSLAQTVGVKYKLLENTFFVLLVLTVVLGLRSVGVMLMAGMLIAPAVSARPWAKSLSSMLLISAIFGMASALLGDFLSFKLSKPSFSLPTGPMILLSASFLCILSLLIAPQRGLLIRLVRMQLFRFRTRLENSLKLLWKKPGTPTSPLIALSLRLRGWITRDRHLTPKGKAQAQRIVRLHRLWEVYLVEYLGQNVDKVHHTAEELEHLFSPALEKELSELLNYPLKDPHQQPIPPIVGGRL